MVCNAYVSEVEFYEVIVTVPALIPEGVSAWTLTAEVKILKPVAIAAALTFFLNVNELREFSSYMIEYTVKDNSYAVFVKLVAYESE